MFDEMKEIAPLSVNDITYRYHNFHYHDLFIYFSCKCYMRPNIVYTWRLYIYPESPYININKDIYTYRNIYRYIFY